MLSHRVKVAIGISITLVVVLSIVLILTLVVFKDDTRDSKSPDCPGDSQASCNPLTPNHPDHPDHIPIVPVGPSNTPGRNTITHEFTTSTSNFPIPKGVNKLQVLFVVGAGGGGGAGGNGFVGGTSARDVAQIRFNNTPFYQYAEPGVGGNGGGGGGGGGGSSGQYLDNFSVMSVGFATLSVIIGKGGVSGEDGGVSEVTTDIGTSLGKALGGVSGYTSSSPIMQPSHTVDVGWIPDDPVNPPLNPGSMIPSAGGHGGNGGDGGDGGDMALCVQGGQGGGPANGGSGGRGGNTMVLFSPDKFNPKSKAQHGGVAGVPGLFGKNGKGVSSSAPLRKTNLPIMGSHGTDLFDYNRPPPIPMTHHVNASPLVINGGIGGFGGGTPFGAGGVGGQAGAGIFAVINHFGSGGGGGGGGDGGSATNTTFAPYLIDKTGIHPPDPSGSNITYAREIPQNVVHPFPPRHGFSGGTGAGGYVKIQFFYE